MTKAYRINIDDIEAPTKSVIDVIAKGKKYIDSHNYKEFYSEVQQSLHLWSDIGLITSILYASGIDPLEYLKEIPCGYLCGSPITGMFNIPYHIEGIHSRAFQNSALKDIAILSDKVLSLHAFTFSGCSNLEKIYIPPTVTNIARYTFENCPRLKSINYQGTVKQWMDIVKSLTWCGSNTDPIIYCVDGKLNKFDQVAD